jgi:hypothetical protein
VKKEVDITYEKHEGFVSIQFKLQNPIDCALTFSSQGRIILEMPDHYSDLMTQFGLHMLFADELKVDMAQLEFNLMATASATVGLPTSQIVNALRTLCLCANLYFKDRAAFYWGIPSSECRAINMQVLSHRYKIAYKQLIEIDSVLVSNI